MFFIICICVLGRGGGGGEMFIGSLRGSFHGWWVVTS